MKYIFSKALFKELIGLIAITSSCSLSAQVRYDYNWFVATGYAPNDSTYGMSRINFQQNPPTLSKVNNTTIDFMGTNVSWSDQDGNFKYFCNGCVVINANLAVMENGDSISPGKHHDIWCKYGYPTQQGALLLPSPNDDSKQFLFHILFTDVFNGTDFNQLYYSKIDLDSMNGLGKVVEKNVPLNVDTICYGQFTAVKHADGKRWWLVAPKSASNGYFTVLLDEDGPELENLQFIGTVQNEKEAGGQAAFSPDGRYYVRANGYNGIEIFEFNRCNGKLFNNKHATPPLPVEAYLGVAISPNSRFLYISSGGVLLQYDLESSDVANSYDTIGVYDGYKSWLQTIFYFMQLGPDDKIYMATGNGTNVMHVINKPNEKGIGCDFQQHSLHLPTYYSFSPPNFPHYRLEAADSNYCDSLALDIGEVELPFRKMLLWPNPSSGQFSVAVSNTYISRVEVFNALGEMVYLENLADLPSKVNIKLPLVASGLYYCVMYDPTGVRYSGKFAKY